jgi:hypothetical protein
MEMEKVEKGTFYFLGFRCPGVVVRFGRDRELRAGERKNKK